MHTFAIVCLALILLIISTIYGIKALRKKYPSEPPLNLMALIPTMTRQGVPSPIISLVRKTYMLGDATNGGGERVDMTIVFSTPEEGNLELGRYNCYPSNDVEDLTYYEYRWPKWWQRVLLPPHRYGDVHHVYPESWIYDNIPVLGFTA